MSKLDMNACKKPDNLVAAKNAKLEARTPNGKGKQSEDVFLSPVQRCDGAMVNRLKGKFYLLFGVIAHLIPESRRHDCTLYAAASSLGGFFIFPAYTEKYKAAEAAEKVVGHWGRITWDENARVYVASEPQGEHGEPAWPFEDFGEMVQAAFGNCLVDREDHPKLKEIVGT